MNIIGIIKGKNTIYIGNICIGSLFTDITKSAVPIYSNNTDITKKSVNKNVIVVKYVKRVVSLLKCLLLPNFLLKYLK